MKNKQTIGVIAHGLNMFVKKRGGENHVTPDLRDKLQQGFLRK